MSIAAGFLQLGNLAHDIVQGVVQLLAAVRNAVHLSMAMCEASQLRLKDFEESSREGSQSTEAIGSEVVFSIQVASNWRQMEIAEVRTVNSYTNACKITLPSKGKVLQSTLGKLLCSCASAAKSA